MTAAKMLLAAVILAGSTAGAANLLQNGNFNGSFDGNWVTWSYGGGWSNPSNDSNDDPNDPGSTYMAVGGDSGSSSSGGGVYQIVSGAPDAIYTLTVDSGVQAWWWPEGEMRLFFLDASGNTLANPIKVVTTAIDSYDTGLPWSTYTLTATSPAGTTQVKVEFASQSGTGTVWFDDASLTASLAYPTISGLYPDGTTLFQATNSLAFTAASTATPINNTNIQVTINGVNVSSSLAITGTTMNKSVVYSGITSNQVYTANIQVTDANGLNVTATVLFDTFSQKFYTWEAEDWDFNGGQFIDNPQTNAYFGITTAIPGEDYNETSTGTNTASWAYRPWVDPSIPVPQTEVTSDVKRAQYATKPDYDVGWFDSGEWLNYTRTYPTGLYNVYARIASPGAATMNLAEVTGGLGTTNETTASLGNFSLQDGLGWGSFSWVPLTDPSGNLVKLNLGGVSTMRVTTGGNANANFFMLVPANTNLPAITALYPDGSMQFQATNALSFNVSSTAGINAGSITVTLSVTNPALHSTTVLTSTNGLTVGGTPNNRTVNYAGLVTNSVYAAVISVTDVNNNTVAINPHFDTYVPVLTWEAEDWDYNSGQFIDNPPVDGYANLHGIEGVDFHDINGTGNHPYRPLDAMSADVVADTPRSQYVAANTNDYAVGYFIIGEWINYTRTMPAGTYNIYGRFAAGGGTSYESLGMVTNGAGTSSQGVQALGNFNVADTGGWSAYAFTPLTDQFGNIAQVTLSGKTTLQLQRTGGADANVNFFMLLPAVTTLPTISQVGPLGWLNSTNALQFVASSTSGIATSNITVTLNGAPATLAFTGSADSWRVSATLAPNTIYSAVLTVKDAAGLVATTTVSLDTFSLNNYTFEAEDYDYSGGQFIDNPQVNAYFGLAGTSGIDYYKAGTGGLQMYRSDAVDTETNSDLVRPQYAGTGYVDYEVGFTSTGDWWNYTRTYPTNQFNVYLRAANGAAATTTMHLQKVTSGWGTSSQTTVALGNFQIPATGGWQTYTWVPLTDSNGKLVIVPLGGQATLRLADGGANLNFLMLAPAVALKTATTGSSLNMSFGTQTGFNYTVLYKNHLTDSTWTPLNTVAGDGTIKSLGDSVKTTSGRFYILEAH
jgi:hypothetical protein